MEKLLGSLNDRHKIVRNVINEIEKLLTRFDLDGQPQPRFFERCGSDP